MGLELRAGPAWQSGQWSRDGFAPSVGNLGLMIAVRVVSGFSKMKSLANQVRRLMLVTEIARGSVSQANSK